MTQATALKRAIKLWGKAGAVRDGGKPTSLADRAAARLRFDAFGKDFPEPRPTDDRTIAELKAWEARGRAWRQARSEAAAYCRFFRYAVGVSSGMFFEVKGEGDTWEQAFAAAEKRSA